MSSESCVHNAGLMSRRSSWWILVAVGAGTFMSALDASVVNVALPVMRTSLGADVAAIQWVVTVYLLTVSGTLLGFGRLGDLKGHLPRVDGRRT